MTKGTRFIRGELIGLPIKVADAKNKSSGCIRGKIVDETKNVFVVECIDGRKKTLLKEGSVFDIGSGNEKVRINGNLLAKRPEERIKMKLR